MQLHLLSVRPDFVGGHFTAGVPESVVMVYNHGARDALDDGFESGVQCAALHLVGGNDISEPAASVGADKNFSGREIPRHGMVTVVPKVRRDEDEGEDQRDHYVVMEAASLVRPEEIAFKNTAHKANFILLWRGVFPLSVLWAFFQPCKANAGLSTAPFLRSGAGWYDQRCFIWERLLFAHPCKEPERPARARSRRPAGSFREWPARCGLQRVRCRSVCQHTRPCFCPVGGSRCLHGAPGRTPYLSRKRFRDRDPVLGARLRYRRSSPNRSPCLRYRAARGDRAIPVFPEWLQHSRSAFRVRCSSLLALRT